MSEREVYTPGTALPVVCMRMRAKYYKNVRKHTAACGRIITDFIQEPHDGNKTDVITCVFKKGSRPTWSTGKAQRWPTASKKNKTLVRSNNTQHILTHRVTHVNCVDCLESPYYAVRILQETKV